ncbi:MAG: TonB-dependent receptor [Saprospiraceae bacterium]|nr:TonB-dependent receptor [Saprospiraceae bacterium]
MKKYLLFLSLIAFNSQLFAQFPGGWGKKKGPSIKGKIEGRILDSLTNEEVPFATISLKKAGSDKIINGTLSEDNGKFKLGDVITGKYDIEISFLGYENKLIPNVETTLKNPDVNLETILFSPSSIVMDAVEVTEERALVENKIDKIVFNAENDASIAGGDATEVLRKVPLLSVDLDGNVSLRGSQNVTILINGKPSGMFASNKAEALQMFPADQIKKVEVITSPSAKFDGEGSAGIINIITKRTEINGFAGSINASVGNRQSNSFLNLNAGKGRFGFNSSGAVFYSHPIDATNSFNRESLVDGQQVIAMNSGITNTSRLGFNGSASAFYDFNAFNAINSSINFRGFGFDRDGTTTGLLDNPTINFLDEFTRDNTSNSLTNGFDWNTDYTKKFEGQEDREWSISAQYSGNVQNQDYTIDEIHNLEFLNRNEIVNNEGDNREYTLQTDYVHPMGKGGKIETGIKGVLRDISSDYEYFENTAQGNVLDNERSNFFEYNQDVISGYAQVNFLLAKKYSVTSGLRYEHTEIFGDFQNGESTVSNKYDNFLPNITIARGFSGFRNLKLSYNKRIQRPSLQFVNPFNNQSSLYNQSIGNPELEPEITHQVELGYNFNVKGFMVFATTYYKITNDIIESIISVDDAGISINTFGNVGTNNSVGLNLFTSKTINKITVRGGGNFFTYNASGVVNGQELEANDVLYNIFFNGDYKISSSFKADFFGFFRSNRRTLQGVNPSFSIYGIGVRKEFKNSSIGIRVVEPFHETKSFDSAIEGSDFVQTTGFTLPFRSIGVNFRYKFGKVDFKERKSKIKNSDLKQGEGDGQSGGGNQGSGGSRGRN